MMDVPWLSRLIIFITVSTFGAKSSSPCPANQFLHPDGICCEFCPIGTYMYKPCQVTGSRSLCFPCEMGMSYMDKATNMTMCKQCSACDPESEVEERECHIQYNRLCLCREGFHRKGTKCGMEESTRGEIDFPSNDLPSRWIWCLPLVIGLLFVIFIFGRRSLHPKNVDNEVMQELIAGLPNVKEDEQRMLDSSISANELEAAVRSLIDEKASGIDGLPGELYMTFWNIVGPDLLDVPDGSICDGELPVSCRRAVVCLLPKSWNPQLAENWRPVSLLCADFTVCCVLIYTHLYYVLIIKFSLKYLKIA